MSVALNTLPGVREAAEAMAREFYAAVVAQRPEGDTRPFDALPVDWQHAEIAAHLALLCDLTRPASVDWWARWLAAHTSWAAWEITAAVEGDYARLCGVSRAVGIAEPGRFEPHPPAAETLVRLCLAAATCPTPGANSDRAREFLTSSAHCDGRFADLLDIVGVRHARRIGDEDCEGAPSPAARFFDGDMECEQHAGVAWPHEDCNGPGMPWRERAARCDDEDDGAPDAAGESGGVR